MNWPITVTVFHIKFFHQIIKYLKILFMNIKMLLQFVLFWTVSRSNI